MRRTARVLVAVTSVLTVLFTSMVATGGPLSPGEAVAGGGGSAAVDEAFVHGLLYSTPLSTFSSTARHRFGPNGRGGDTWFDWSTDLCSAPLVGNTGLSFDFTEPCRRHDFGYRNTKLLDQRYGIGWYWNGRARKDIDLQFLTDMKNSCRSRPLVLRPSCNAWAHAFYGAVRTFGGP